MPQGKWEISKLLDEFEKELLSRERIKILNSDNPNPDPPLFSRSTLHLQAQKGQPKTNQISCTYYKQNHPSNICSVVLPMSKLENKFLLTKPDVFIVYVKDTSLKIVLNPRNVIFVKLGIIFQFVIQKPKSNDSRNPPKNVPPKGILQQTPEQETEEANVKQVISSVENFILNENIGNDTTTTLFAENWHAQKNVLLQASQASVSSINSTSKGQREFYLIIVLKKVSSLKMQKNN